MALDIQQEVINIFAWLGVVFTSIFLHHKFVGPLFTHYGYQYALGSAIGIIFGIVAGKFLYAWYVNKT